MPQNVADPTQIAQIVASVESGASLADAMRKAGLDPRTYIAASHRRAIKEPSKPGDAELLAAIDPAMRIAANAVRNRCRAITSYGRWRAPRN